MSYGQQMTFPNYQPNYQQYPPNYQNYQQYPQNTQISAPQTGQPISQQQMQTTGQTINQQQMQIQNGGIMHVRNMQEALNYPVAPGTSVTFKDENAPYVYTKTRGFSQMEQPIFDVYELKKVENTPQGENSHQNDDEKQQAENVPQYVLQEKFDMLCDFVDTLQDEIDLLKKKNETEQDTAVKKSASRARKEKEGADNA